MLPPLEWTQFRLHTLEGSMTYEEVLWASFHGRRTEVGFSPRSSSETVQRILSG
jgi:hypothetical protein